MAGRSLEHFVEAPNGGDDATFRFSYPKPGTTAPLAKLSIIKQFRPWNVMVSTAVWIDDIEAEYRATLLRLSLFGIAVLAVVGRIACVVNGNIASSLGRLKDKMAKLAVGGLDVAIAEIERRDEIGGMARAVRVFKDNGEPVDKAGNAAAAVTHAADGLAAQANALRHEVDQFLARLRAA